MCKILSPQASPLLSSSAQPFITPLTNREGVASTATMLSSPQLRRKATTGERSYATPLIQGVRGAV